jgi:glycogen synthase
VRIGFEGLAHLIYVDFFLMPSQYEPCGLGQLIAMRYGTVPIARKTGGLADTIQDYDHMKHTGTGFLFSDYTPYALQDAVKRAICVFTDKTNMKKMAREAIKNNFSWSRSTDKYIELTAARLVNDHQNKIVLMLSGIFVGLRLSGQEYLTISEHMGIFFQGSEMLYNELDRI